STTTSHGAGDPGPAVTGPAGLRCCATATPPSACTSSASSPSAATARNGVVAAPASAAGGLGEDDAVGGVVPHGVVEGPAAGDQPQGRCVLVAPDAVGRQLVLVVLLDRRDRELVDRAGRVR